MFSQRADWIAAIRKSPDDDALRLAFSDWLEKRGGRANTARAEFIRIQVQRAILADHDPRQCELQARELRLLKNHAREWCGVHFAFRKARFRRGFIEYVHLHLRHFLHHRRQLLDLEPIRDISLTGWFRAPDNLVRRVAACEELQHIETLRIHHQGPHKDPRGNVILLLESPHWTQLRALHCSGVQFDLESRRHFERLPILRRVRELHLPYLNSFVEPPPGEWLQDGGVEFAEKWSELRSLFLPNYLASDSFRRLSEMPFWSHLTELEMTHGSIEDIKLLSERLPPSLSTFTFTGDWNTRDRFSPFKPLFNELAHVPLQNLRLSNIVIPTKALTRLLDGEDAWKLKELSFAACDTSSDRARILSSSPGLVNLQSLTVTSDWSFDARAAKVLFSSPVFRSLVHLNLYETRAGKVGAKALAASGLQRLRSLELGGVGTDTASLRAIVTSPNFRSLTWLALSDCGSPDDPTIDVSLDLSTKITQLPHLATLSLYMQHCDPRSVEILTGDNGVAWTWICSGDEVDIQEYRTALAPECWPPVDIRWPNSWASWRTENGGAPV